MKERLRKIPPVHELQRDSRFAEIMQDNGIDFIHMTNQLKKTLHEVKGELLNGTWEGEEPGTASFIGRLFHMAEASIKKEFGHSLLRVINATGTILHTNLGRARLSERAASHAMETARNYSNLEYKLDEGTRGSRHSHAESLLKELTGAEAAMVVNNNAAAVYLILKALAAPKEVIVSRGQLVEIGGSFRISSIMEESGARLAEVGTTNKTHLFDYEEAITDQTAMILKVHTSNFKVIGFSESAGTEELAELARRKGVLLYEDLGSGALYDFRKNGIGGEPVVREVLSMGADLVSFSGDKLLGGPQAGIIAGKKELIDQLKKHQLARVLRVDKMTIAALEGTLLDYLNGEEGIKNIPVLRDMLTPSEELKARTEAFIVKVGSLDKEFDIGLTETSGQVGGGTMPDVELSSYAAVLKHKRHSAEQVARMLRNHTPAIIVRIRKEGVLVDLRTVTQEEEACLLDALRNV